MVEMVVPAQVMLGERATLQCIFDMEGEELYSVKWYKAGHEFFRYIPGDRERPEDIHLQPAWDHC